MYQTVLVQIKNWHSNLEVHLFNLSRPIGALALALATSTAQAALIDFESHSAGTIIDDEYSVSNGVTINGVNIDRGNASNLAVVFDTGSPSGDDDDLGAPFTNATLGNFDPGHVLIIHEHPRECDGSTCNDPDDEGSRPAGYFDIDFGGLVTLNSIDFFDIEGTENGAGPHNSILLFDDTDTEISPNTFYSPGTGGDNTWGRLAFEIAGVSSMRLHLGGSGAIDNIDFTRPPTPPQEELPIPGTPLLLLLGLAGLLSRRKVKG